MLSGICRHFKHSSSSLPILLQPICKFPLGTWLPRIGDQSGRPITMLRANASLSLALSLLVQGGLLPWCYFVKVVKSALFAQALSNIWFLSDVSYYSYVFGCLKVEILVAVVSYIFLKC